MIVMERKVFLACLITTMISALIVPVNQIVADEPANLVKLTPFSVSLLEEDFDKFALVHPILLLETGKSANVHVRVQNYDVQETHEIKFYISFVDSSMAEKVTISFDRQSVTLSPNTFAEVLMHVKAKSNLNETYHSAVGIAAYSTTFGAVGKLFHLVAGKNVTESDTSWFDLRIREALPGYYFNLDQDISRAHMEELYGAKIHLPSFLPEDYELRGLESYEDGIKLIYSTFEITNKTEVVELWRKGGMVILYNNDPQDFDDYLLPWIAYSEGQEVMVNDFIGTIVEQREQLTIAGTKFKTPSVLHLFKDDFSIELMATLSVDELLKVAASMSYQEQSQAHNAQDFTFRRAINLTENGNGQFPQVVAAGNNVYVLWGERVKTLLRASTDNGISFGEPARLDVYGVDVYASGSAVYIVGIRFNNIQFQSSSDNGRTFNDAIDLSNNAGASMSPKIAVSGSNVYVAWEDYGLGDGEIFFRASNDEGSNFVKMINLSNSSSRSMQPQIAASGENVYVTWAENSVPFTNSGEIFFRASNDHGVSFADTISLSNDSTRSSEPLIAASGSNVYVVWENHHQNEDGSWERDLFFRASHDGGTTFGNIINLTENAGDGYRKQIAASGDNVYVAWNSGRTLFFWSSDDNGKTFNDAVKLSDKVGSQGLQWQPKIGVSGNNVHIVWTDGKDIFFRTSRNNGHTFDDIIVLNSKDAASGAKGGIDLAVSGSMVYAVWHESPGAFEVLFRASSPYAFIGTVSERGCNAIGGNIVTDWIDSQHTQQVELCNYNDEYFKIRDLEGGCEDEVKWAKDPKTQRVLEFGSPCHVPSTWIVCGQGPGVLAKSGDEIILNLIVECDKSFGISVAGSVDDPNMQFDKEMKRLIVVLRTKQFTPVNITLPRELLDGPYSIKMTQQHHVGKIKGEWVVNQNSTHASLFRELKQDMTTIEITGATAIPEFPVVWIILIASFFVVSMYARYFRRFKYARI